MSLPVPEPIQLLARLDPFGNYPQVQRPAHLDDGRDDSCVLTIRRQVYDEGSADLERVGGEFVMLANSLAKGNVMNLSRVRASNP